MTKGNKISEMLKSNAKKAKKLFDLCEKNNEGIFNKIHIIDNSRFSERRKKSFAFITVMDIVLSFSRERIELAEDESNDSSIDKYEYSFDEGMFEGFKEITVEKAIILLNQI